jgi:polysaccharide biosynthesis protein PslJ
MSIRLATRSPRGMRVIQGGRAAEPTVAATVVLVSIAAIAGAALDVLPAKALIPLAVMTSLLAATHKSVLRWRSLFMLLIAVILFIPIRRYILPASLPFQLEPYRLLVAFIAFGWLTSLLIDPRVSIRSTGYELPLAVFLGAAVMSLVLNPDRVSEVAPVLTKALMFFVSYLVVMYIVPSVIRTLSDIDKLLKVLVAGGAVVAVSAVYESRTGYNVFDHLSKVLPFLKIGAIPFADGEDPTGTSRGGTDRAYASAQHPIALGAAFAILLPLGPYLYRRTTNRLWLVATALLLVGVFTTVSRTGFVMVITSLIVFLVLRGRQVRRYWPALIPALAVIHFAVPGTLGSVVNAFFPKGGLVAQEHKNAVGSGRLATLGPVLSTEFAPRPLFGDGFETRVIKDDGAVKANAPILDDQWAGVLVEVGIVGALGLLWFFARIIRRLGSRGRADESDEAWLAVALCAAITAYVVGMFTYDAFSFIQVTFLSFILLGLSASVLRLRQHAHAPARVRHAAAVAAAR